MSLVMVGHQILTGFLLGVGVNRKLGLMDAALGFNARRPIDLTRAATIVTCRTHGRIKTRAFPKTERQRAECALRN